MSAMTLSVLCICAYVRTEARSLVAPVKLVEPEALKSIVLDGRERSGLVEATELDVCVHS